MCRSLFEKDKLLFSLALAVGLMKGRGEVDDDEWRFLLTGGVGATPDKPNPAPEWMGEKIWGAFHDQHHHNNNPHAHLTTPATTTTTTTATFFLRCCTDAFDSYDCPDCSSFKVGRFSLFSFDVRKNTALAHLLPTLSPSLLLISPPFVYGITLFLSLCL